ncbi:Tumor necrosis factor receptor superfamily member 9 [Labeo rohita]|uniref:Tumor necrosis factor receptor superfamily member 9 n=1 Tax=Labeo rohita TaxID=84645 RepID=A0ABQ8MLQ9_LABRO|nr:Tumor necrosis factor receptor superfamily member 9 [Labeo rohita]
MVCYRKVLLDLLCLLLVHQNAGASCPAGQRLNYNTRSCEPCLREQYKSTSSTDYYCSNCSKCKRGSKEIKSCTPTSNTECKCNPGFTPVDQLNEICICKQGFGIKEGKECKKCDEGFFTDQEDSDCKKWKDSTSDAVCKNASKEVTDRVVWSTTLSWTTTISTPSQTTTVSSTATSRTKDSSPNNSGKDNSNSLCNLPLLLPGLIMVCAGILLLAGLLYHKCKFTHCIQNHKKVDFRKVYAESLLKNLGKSACLCLSNTWRQCFFLWNIFRQRPLPLSLETQNTPRLWGGDSFRLNFFEISIHAQLTFQALKLNVVMHLPLVKPHDC